MGFLLMLIGLAGTAMSACDGDMFSTECACTADFRIITVTVVDSTGAPVPGLEVTVRRARDGVVLESTELGGLQAGVYPVVDDNSTLRLRPSGEVVRFVASNGTDEVASDFVVGTDGCRCHVRLYSGPDTLVFPE